MVDWRAVFLRRPTPLGVAVGLSLLAVSSLTLLLPDRTGHVPAPAPLVRQLRQELDHSQERADRFAHALDQANRQLTAAGRSPVTTTAPSVPGSAPQSPSPGPPGSTAPTRHEIAPGVVEGPPVGTVPSATAPAPATTAPPATNPGQPPTTDDGCPPGTHPVIRVVVPPVRARVCVPDNRSQGTE